MITSKNWPPGGEEEVGSAVMLLKLRCFLVRMGTPQIRMSIGMISTFSHTKLSKRASPIPYLDLRSASLQLDLRLF